MNIDKLDDIVNKYSNTYHRTIKINPVDVKSSTCTDFKKENHKGGQKLKVDDQIRISKYENISQKVTLQICLKKFFWLKKLKSTVRWTYFLSDLNGE